MNTMEETLSNERLEDITGVTCIYVPVRNVYESVQWYEANLGCKLRKGDKMVPEMTGAIMRFPDQDGNFAGPGLRSKVPALFLLTATDDAGSYGFTNDAGNREAAACFITPRIQDMYNRFKENRVNIITEFEEDRPCGPNFAFRDPDGNQWELWQPPGESNHEHVQEDLIGMTCIYIPVRDVYESAQWYEANLGCKLRKGDKMVPEMTAAIMRFPDRNGEPHGATGVVPCVFLLQATNDPGSYGYTNDNGERKAVACYITPRIQDMYNRFKENGVNIVTEIPENRPCGPNFAFRDPDGNQFEIWRP